MPTFKGVSLSGGTISYRPGMRRESYPVAGVEAWVETAGQIDRRMSLTRTGVGALAFGPFGAIVGALAKKKIDDTHAFLIVRGPQFAWCVDVMPKMVGSKDRKHRARLLRKAHRFAGKVTSAGSAARYAAASPVPVRQPYPTVPPPGA